MAYNPKLKQFIEENPNKSVIGFAWSLYWRLTTMLILVYFAAWIVVGFVMVVFNAN